MTAMAENVEVCADVAGLFALIMWQRNAKRPDKREAAFFLMALGFIAHVTATGGLL